MWLMSLLFMAQQFASIPDAPGRLVHVGGQKVHIYCTGSGDPTVVLEAGASSFSIDAGIVLVDPTHELRLYTQYEGKAVPIASLSAEQYRSILPKLT